MRSLIHVLALLPVLFGSVPAFVCAGELLPTWSWRLAEEELYVYRFDMDGLNWRQIRQEREQRRTVQEKPKHLELVRGLLSDPFAAVDPGAVPPLPAGMAVIRDPDGARKTIPVTPGMREIVLPEDLGLNGRYLVGGHFQLDGHGNQRVHLYPKLMVGHFKGNGRPGSTPAFFFDDPAIALEIGSARSPAMFRMGGGLQRPHESAEMEVRFQGHPLARATVEAIAEGSGWRRSYRTDASGRFTVIPFDDRSGQRHYEKLLYVVRVEDPNQHALHIATLPMIIFRNQPEWTSHVAGYMIWAGLGLGGTLLLAGGAMLRNQRQQRLSLVRFSQCRIKED
ncbi:hypothetical protein [Desulfobulbus propionicus]